MVNQSTTCTSNCQTSNPVCRDNLSFIADLTSAAMTNDQSGSQMQIVASSNARGEYNVPCTSEHQAHLDKTRVDMRDNK